METDLWQDVKGMKNDKYVVKYKRLLFLISKDKQLFKYYWWVGFKIYVRVKYMAPIAQK